ncbi:hypothetical protein [Leptolyngbya sp. PL-A3]|uniref:hypothetical protein n=1 Tax=Leptolyngbya sp. PL-A3 TaxID=2933911 RepID=UPI003298FAA6
MIAKPKAQLPRTDVGLLGSNLFVLNSSVYPFDLIPPTHIKPRDYPLVAPGMSFPDPPTLVQLAPTAKTPEHWWQ